MAQAFYGPGARLGNRGFQGKVGNWKTGKGVVPRGGLVSSCFLKVWLELERPAQTYVDLRCAPTPWPPTWVRKGDSGDEGDCGDG